MRAVAAASVGCASTSIVLPATRRTVHSRLLKNAISSPIASPSLILSSTCRSDSRAAAEVVPSHKALRAVTRQPLERVRAARQPGERHLQQPRTRNAARPAEVARAARQPCRPDQVVSDFDRLQPLADTLPRPI